MVNLELYKVFYTVAKCKSLTKAAEELFITQPAVSQAIKQLETQLGMPLFTRTRTGVELSAQGGALVFPDVERALNVLSGVEDKLSELKDSAKGTLRIGASDAIFRYFLLDVIAEYHRLYPMVKLELITDFTPKTIENLKIDRCDVGFLTLPIEEDRGIILTDALTQLNDVFVAGEKYARLKKSKLNLFDLQEYPLILLQERTIARDLFDRFVRKLNLKLRPAIEVDDFELMKRLVAEGMGIGCLPREFLKDELKSGALFLLDTTPTLPSRSIGTAVSKTYGTSFALKTFLNMVKKR